MTDKQNNPDPIAHAARLLREAAEELRQAHTYPRSEDWGRETDAKAAYDEHMAAAQALEDWEAAVGAGGVQALSAAPAGFVPVSAFDRLHAHAESLAARLLAASPTPPAEQQAAPKAAPGAPIAWTPGPNLFKDWCAQWFGPDSDDDYLAKAVFNLPPMAQVFKEAAPQQEAQEPVAWESTILGYIKYITQAQYEKFRPNVRRWYKPYKCSSCAAPQPAPAPLSEREAFEAWIKKDGGDLGTFGTPPNMHYRNSAVNNAWVAWKARAALAAQGGQ